MVPFVGVFTSLMVSLAIKIYLAYFCALGSRSPAFEAWCAGRPLVAAFFCPRAATGPLLERLRVALAGREFVNVAGAFPWPHYRVKFTVVALDESVVGVCVAWCGLVRGNQQRPTPLPLILEICGLALGIEEVWLHRDLHSDGTIQEPEVTWRGRPAQGSEVTFRAFSELPFWLRRFDGKGPPDRRAEQPLVAEQEAPVLVGAS